MYSINGKFACDRFTGMQRYAYEILRELDCLVKPSEVELIVPRRAAGKLKYRNIRVVPYGLGKGILWEQICLPFYLITHRKKECLNMLSIVPMLTPRGIVVAHGVNYKVNPQYFKTPRDKLSRLWHIINFWWYFHFTQRIITVSEFSRSEIVKTYHVSPERLRIIPNAWQHMQDIREKEDALKSFPRLNPGEYYFSLSSINDNKNFKWIALAAQRNPDSLFAIAGGRNLKEYLTRMGIRQPENLLFLGRVSDEEMKSILVNCKAFLFPTFYEGFGIPPMEALACGAPIIVSDTPTMHEVYQNSAHYIDPYNYDVDLDEILREPVAPASEVLDRFSWRHSAEMLYQELQEKEAARR